MRRRAGAVLGNRDPLDAASDAASADEDDADASDQRKGAGAALQGGIAGAAQPGVLGQPLGLGQSQYRPASAVRSQAPASAVRSQAGSALGAPGCLLPSQNVAHVLHPTTPACRQGLEGARPAAQSPPVAWRALAVLGPEP